MNTTSSDGTLPHDGVLAVVVADIRRGDLVERLIPNQVAALTAAGASGFVVGIASEADRMRPNQVRQLLEAVRSSSSLPIVCGVYGSEAVQPARLASLAAAGATALMVSAPNPLDTTTLEELVGVAAAVAPAVVLQEPIGGRLPDATTLEGLTSRGLTHVKFEAKRSGPAIAGLSHAVPQLRAIAGWGGFDYPNLFRCGAALCMPAADCGPLLVPVHRALVDNDPARAVLLYERILPLLAFVGQDIDLIVAAAKRRLQTIGLLESEETLGARSPLAPFEAAEIDRLWDALDARHVVG